MRSVIAGAILLASLPVNAASVTVTFNEEEYRALMQLIELGVKQGGLAVAGNAVYLVKKLEAAQIAEPIPAPSPTVPSDGQ